MEDIKLLEFCVTPRQRKIIEMRAEGVSWGQMAKILQSDEGTLRRSSRAVRNRAAAQGYAPDYDMVKLAPDGFRIKGTSTYYDEDGRVRGQWVKTDADRARQAELDKAFIEGLAGEVTPAKRTKIPKSAKYSTETLPAVLIGDAHIGMRAFGQETKHHDFDTGIATAQLKDAFHYLTERAESSETAMFVNVGDLIHANSQHNQTYGGTPLDVDSRHHSVMKAAAECMAYGINLQLQKHKNVIVVMARGNHDTDAAGHLQLMLEFYYKDEPRVNVLPSHGFFHYVEWKKNLIGIHHGDKQKAERLGTSMARDMPEAWGRCNYRMWLTGHFHKDAVTTLPGVTHKVCAALPPPDSWHASNGFAGDGEMELLTFKAGGGIHSSFKYHVPQPRVEPDARVG